MLRSLEIRNYRNLRHLTIEKLGRVNLLVGKNNTGKTSVLEAVGILIKKGRIRFLLDLLDQRDENYISSLRYNTGKDNDALRSFSSLHSNRLAVFNADDPLTITGIEESLSKMSLSIRLIKYKNEDLNENNKISRTKILVDEKYDEYEVETGIEIRSNGNTLVVPFNVLWRVDRQIEPEIPSANFDFIRTNSLSRDINGVLWDDITFTEKEKYVLQALKIIEDDIEGLAFIDSEVIGTKGRVPVVRLGLANQKIPLRSMGDGINRILTIILAMVNCENGYLLIDEFENGLHYSVQEKLWEIIFYLAERLNIQVFATTHSLDCVEAFSAVLNNGKQDSASGAMIRLENYESNIEATVYDADEIQSTTRVHVDPR